MPSGEAGHGNPCTWRYTLCLHLLGTGLNRTEPRSSFACLKGKCSWSHDTSADSLSVWKSPWGEKSDHRSLCSPPHLRLDQWEETCIFSLNSLYDFKRKKKKKKVDMHWALRTRRGHGEVKGTKGSTRKNSSLPSRARTPCTLRGQRPTVHTHPSSTPEEPAGAKRAENFTFQLNVAMAVIHYISVFLFLLFHSFSPTLPCKSHDDLTVKSAPLLMPLHLGY